MCGFFVPINFTPHHDVLDSNLELAKWKDTWNYGVCKRAKTILCVIQTIYDTYAKGWVKPFKTIVHTCPKQSVLRDLAHYIIHGLYKFVQISMCRNLTAAPVYH